MRTFNVRFAAILLAVVVIFGGGVYFLHGYQVRRNAEVFLKQALQAKQQAEEAVKQRDRWRARKAERDAVTYMKWYVRLMPTDPKTREQLGLMMLQYSHLSTIEDQQNVTLAKDLRMFKEGLDQLETVLRQDPDRDEARHELTRILILLQRYRDAREHLAVLLKKSPKDAQLLEWLGQCQQETGGIDVAIETLKNAIKSDPKQLTAYEKLAHLYRSARVSKPKEADQWMRKLVETNPKSARAHYMRGRYLLDPKTGSLDEALKEATKALELAPDDTQVLLLATTCYMLKGQLDEARQLAERGVKLYPTNADMYLTKAEVDRRKGDADKAIATLKQGLKILSLNSDLLWALGNILIDANRLQDAQEVISDLRKTSTPKENAAYLRARILFAEGKWLAARSAFEAVRPASIDPHGTMARQGLVRYIDLWIAQCQGKLGNQPQQVEAYRRAISFDPTFVLARVGLIDVLTNLGQYREAIQELQDWGRYGKLPAGVSVQLARLLLLDTLRRPPAARDWTVVEKAIAEAEKRLPDAPEILILRVEMLRNQDRNADAEKLINAAAAKNPKQPSLLRAQLALAETRSDWTEAERLLGELTAAIGDVPAARVEKAQYLVRRYGKNKKEAADGIRKLADGTDKFTLAQCVQLWEGLAALAAQAGDSKLANDLEQRLAEKQPNDVRVRYAFFDRALAARDTAAMEKALNDMERVAGQDARWFYGKAMLLVFRAEADKDLRKRREAFQQALNYLLKAQDAQRSWSRVPLMMAEVYMVLGMPDKALLSYREAVDLGVRDAGAMQRFVRLLLQMRQFNEADKLIRQSEGEQGDRLSPGLVRLGAEVALALGETDRAITLARKGVSADAKDYTEHLWLAQVLALAARQLKAANQDAKRADGLMADAEKAARRAVELEPKRPQTWLSLVRLLALAGDEAKAEGAIRDATAKLPEKAVPLTVAQCYDAIGKTEIAEDKYKAAIAAAPQDPDVARAVADFYLRSGRVEAAEAQLAKLLDGKTTPKKADVMWARQRQAMIFVTRGAGYKNELPKARALIRKNLSESEASVFDRRLDALIDASDPDPTVRAEGARKLAELQKTQAASPDDRLTLAQMYLHAGDWGKASAEYRNLVTSSDREPRYLAAYITALLQHGETSSAEMYIDRLEGLTPHQFLPVSLRADLFLARKDPRKSLAVLNAYIDDRDSLPKDPALRGRIVAEKLSQLRAKLTDPGQKPLANEFARRAEAISQAYFKQNSGQGLLKAMFLAGLGKMDESLDTFEQSWDRATPQEFFRACGAIWDGGTKFSDKQVTRFDNILQKAYLKFGKPGQFQSMRAELGIRQGRYAEAEQLYRETLTANKDDAVAMNNLAVLLALQGKKLDEALTLMNRAIEIAGPIGAILDSRATVYIARHDSENAIKDMQAALKDAETPLRLFHLAQAYQLAGRDREAKETMRKAIKAGVRPDMLQPLELPAFEKMRQLAR